MRRRPHAEIFQIFAAPVRLVIFDRLGRKPRTAGELAKELPVGRTAVVQHLAVLKKAGLVTCRADGRRQIYYAASAALQPLRDWLARF